MPRFDAYPVAIFAAQRRLRRVEIDARTSLPSRTISLAGDEQLRDMRRVGAGEDEIDRLDRHNRVAVERVEVEHENVGRLRRLEARRRPARHWRSGRWRHVRVEPVAPRDDGLESPAAVQEMAEPHLAHDVVVLVERRGVDADARRGSRAGSPREWARRRWPDAGWSSGWSR